MSEHIISDGVYYRLPREWGVMVLRCLNRATKQFRVVKEVRVVERDECESMTGWLVTVPEHMHPQLRACEAPPDRWRD